MNLIKVGNGEKFIICLHGWGQDKTSLMPVLHDYEPEYTVYFLDLPGFGDLQGMEQAMSVHDYAKYVVDFMIKHQIKTATFIGHSFGARVITEINKYDHNLVEKVIFIGGAGIKDSLSLKAYVRQTIYKSAKAVINSPLYSKNREKYLAELQYLFGSSDYLNADPVMRETLVKAVNYDQSEDLKLIKAPTLLIWGALDDQTPLHHARKMYTNIKNAQLEVFEDGTHFVFNEKPLEVASLIRNFVRGDK